MNLTETTFTRAAEKHRRELHVHCYRMLGSFHEADDAVQETFLRAWKHRDQLESGHIRAWLYRVATNVCIDDLRGRRFRATRLRSLADLPWIEPYPDRLLDEIGTDGDPEAIVVARETIGLTFLASLQVLPPRQRAALVARDVLGLSARETAYVLDTTVAAANSAVQRARSAIRDHLPSNRAAWRHESRAEDERVLRSFIDAHERGDVAATLSIAAADIRVTMPPYALEFHGHDAILTLTEDAIGMGDWRLVSTWVNRMPAAVSYLRRWGQRYFRVRKVDVLRVENRKIAEITTFGEAVASSLGLPKTLARST